LHSTEHTFVERKTTGDQKDWVKTVVAFANTLEPTQEAVLFIGVKDGGEIEDKPSNLDKLQMTLSEKTTSIYPPVYYTTKIIKNGDRECLAVIVPGSSTKPHFAGPLFLRDLSQTVVASSEKYESLLAARTSKAHELQKWVGCEITIIEFQRSPGISYQVNETSKVGRVLACNQFYLTVLLNNHNWSCPLASLEISYDDAHARLKIERTLVQSGH
jgi:hypothetical protein